MTQKYLPRCPIVHEECDDPGCPGPRNCVLRQPDVLLRWCQRRPDHYLAARVLLDAFDPSI